MAGSNKGPVIIQSQSNSPVSESVHTEDVLNLMYQLTEYRSQEIRQRLEKVGSAASMLHLDVLLLIYHFAKVAPGNVLEIGPYVGGSTVAAAFGARESDTPKKIISVEAGGELKHRRIPSRNIFKDLKKNLARFGVSESVALINGYSFEETTISAVRQMLGHGEVGLFIFDADGNVRRDLDCYGDLLANGCWLVIDDYFGPCVKAAPRQAQINELVSAGRLVPFGFYGWSTWVGQWRT
jgi:predicted O-methyltransferase YrrM